MVTPFGDDGELRLDVAADLANWLIDNGNDGLVIAGTTGESPTLSHEEQGDLISTVVEAVGDRATVVAGAGSNNTAAAIDLIERAQEAGADAILSVAPYYNRPNQEGLYDHFKANAQATDLPVIVYDIPVRTGRKVETDTLLRLAHDVPNIAGIKDAAGSPDETGWVLANAPDGFQIYSGDDSMTLPLMSIGAVGVIGVATHWAGAEHQAMFDAWEAGDVARAAEINRQLMPSYRFETGNDAPNPIPTKAMMRLLGIPVGMGRSPMHNEPDFVADAAREVIADLSLAPAAAASSN